MGPHCGPGSEGSAGKVDGAFGPEGCVEGLWKRVLRMDRPEGRRVRKFDGPSGRGLWIALSGNAYKVSVMREGS